MMYVTIMSSVTTRRKSSCHSHGETTRQFISPCGSLGEICQSWNYMHCCAVHTVNTVSHTFNPSCDYFERPQVLHISLLEKMVLNRRK